MKKFSSSTQMFSENLKKYLKRAGVVVVSTSLGVASVITISSDEANLHSKAKMVAVAQTESTVIEDTKVEYSKIEYSDLQYSISESEQMAKVEKSEKEAEAVALAMNEETTEAEDSGYVSTVSTNTKSTTSATTKKATTEETEEETEEETTEEIALANEDNTSGKTTTNSDKKQQVAIEATEEEETVKAVAIEVESDTYESGTYLGTYTATAYCGCSKCCGKSDGVTASGTKATQGRTIAAPSSFAFGTELVIDGHTYVVEDRGGSISGKRIDIYFESHSDAVKFGKQKVEVYVK